MHGATVALMMMAMAGEGFADASDPVVRAELSPRCALEVDMRRDEQAACWRLDCVDAAPKPLGCDSTALHQVVAVDIAPGQAWMAVLSVGEGHPMLEIVPLPEFLAGQPYRAQCTINPYPGTVNVERWEAGKLLLSSDVDLRIEESGARADGIGEDRRYALDPQDCTLGN